MAELELISDDQTVENAETSVENTKTPQRSNGLTWALSMFGLDFLETLALGHVVFFDQSYWEWNDLVEIWFVVNLVSLALQLIGVVLVSFRWFRLGGILQIVSSSVHVPKGDGIIGVIGGWQAYCCGL